MLPRPAREAVLTMDAYPASPPPHAHSPSAPPYATKPAAQYAPVSSHHHHHHHHQQRSHPAPPTPAAVAASSQQPQPAGYAHTYYQSTRSPSLQQGPAWTQLAYRSPLSPSRPSAALYPEEGPYDQHALFHPYDERPAVEQEHYAHALPHDEHVDAVAYYPQQQQQRTAVPVVPLGPAHGAQPPLVASPVSPSSRSARSVSSSRVHARQAPVSPPFVEVLDSFSPPLPASPFSSATSPISASSSPTLHYFSAAQPATQHPHPPGADVHYLNPVSPPAHPESLPAIVVTAKPASPLSPPVLPVRGTRPLSPRNRSYSQTDVRYYSAESERPMSSMIASPTSAPLQHAAYSSSRGLSAMQEHLHSLHAEIARERERGEGGDRRLMGLKIQEAKELQRKIMQETMNQVHEGGRDEYAAMYDDSSSSGSGSSVHSVDRTPPSSWQDHNGQRQEGGASRATWPAHISHNPPHHHPPYHPPPPPYVRHATEPSGPSPYTSGSGSTPSSAHSTPSPPLYGAPPTGRYATLPSSLPPHLPAGPPPAASRSNKRTRSRSEGYSADAHVPGLPSHVATGAYMGSGASSLSRGSHVHMHWHSKEVKAERSGLGAVQEHDDDEHRSNKHSAPYPPPPSVDGTERTFSAPNSASLLEGDRYYASQPTTPVLSPGYPNYAHSHSTSSSPSHGRVIAKPRSASIAGSAPPMVSPAHRGGGVVLDGRVSPVMDSAVGGAEGAAASFVHHPSPSSSASFRSPAHRAAFNFPAPSPRSRAGEHVELHTQPMTAAQPLPVVVKHEPAPASSPVSSHFVVASSMPMQAQPLAFSLSSGSCSPSAYHLSEDDESLEHPSALHTAVPKPSYQLFPGSVTSLSASPPPLPPAKKPRKKRRKSKDLPECERWYCPLSCGKYFRRTSSRSISEHMKSCPKLPSLAQQEEAGHQPTVTVKVELPSQPEGERGDLLPRTARLTCAMEDLSLSTAKLQAEAEQRDAHNEDQAFETERAQ